MFINALGGWVRVEGDILPSSFREIGVARPDGKND